MNLGKELILEIAILVHGRFHMFDLAKSLIAQGLKVTIFTNYPPWAVKKFDLPMDRVVAFSSHGYLSKMIPWILGEKNARFFEQFLHKAFGKWAKKQLIKRQPKNGWSAILGMSGIAEEAFLHYKKTKTLCVLHRGSTHIREQWEILDQEEKRTKIPIDKPSSWIVNREEREYQIADMICVQSYFALKGFNEKGVENKKLRVVPLGVDLNKFFNNKNQSDKKIQDIKNKNPLKILGVGNFSMQKGAFDLQKIVLSLPKEKFNFKFVGAVSSDAYGIYKNIRHVAKFIPKVPQSELQKEYAWGDIFLLPSIQDGFAVVVTQAMGCGLPVIVSQNTGSNLFVEEGSNGWIVPIRSPQYIIDLLMKLEQDRELLANVMKNCQGSFKPWTWDDVARKTCQDLQELTSLKN